MATPVGLFADVRRTSEPMSNPAQTYLRVHRCEPPRSPRTARPQTPKTRLSAHAKAQRRASRRITQGVYLKQLTLRQCHSFLTPFCVSEVIIGSNRHDDFFICLTSRFNCYNPAPRGGEKRFTMPAGSSLNYIDFYYKDSTDDDHEPKTMQWRCEQSFDWVEKRFAFEKSTAATGASLDRYAGT